MLEVRDDDKQAGNRVGHYEDDHDSPEGASPSASYLLVNIVDHRGHEQLGDFQTKPDVLERDELHEVDFGLLVHNHCLCSVNVYLKYAGKEQVKYSGYNKAIKGGDLDLKPSLVSKVLGVTSLCLFKRNSEVDILSVEHSRLEVEHAHPV